MGELLGEPSAAGPEAARLHLEQLAARLLSWIEASMPGTLRAALHPDFPSALSEGHAPAGAEAIMVAVTERIASLQDGGGIAPEARADEAARTLCWS